MKLCNNCPEYNHEGRYCSLGVKMSCKVKPVEWEGKIYTPKNCPKEGDDFGK